MPATSAEKRGHDGGGQFTVMRGLAPGLCRASTPVGKKQYVGGRDKPDKPGHDGDGEFTVMRALIPRIDVCLWEESKGVAGTSHDKRGHDERAMSHHDCARAQVASPTAT